MAKKKKALDGENLIGNTEHAVKEVAEYVEKDGTDFNKKLAVEEENEKKLPIDKLIDIASNAGLLEELSPDQKFKKFVTGIKLHDIVYDCMQSSLNEYCKEYNKINPDHNLGLKLHLRKRTNNVKAVFSCDLVLEMRRAGLYKDILRKNVSFTHVREVRDEASWKYSLYGAMFNTLIAISVNNLILQDDIDSGRIKSEVSQ
jgi:hypothetical protein